MYLPIVGAERLPSRYAPTSLTSSILPEGNL
jgi:hypothetical protein